MTLCASGSIFNVDELATFWLRQFIFSLAVFENYSHSSTIFQLLEFPDCLIFVNLVSLHFSIEFPQLQVRLSTPPYVHWTFAFLLSTFLTF